MDADQDLKTYTGTSFISVIRDTLPGILTVTHAPPVTGEFSRISVPLCCAAIISTIYSPIP